MKKAILILGLTFGVFVTGYPQEYLREDIIKLKEISTDKKYGYSQNKPIKVGSIDKEYHFLNALRGPNGEKLNYKRNGSFCVFKSKPVTFGKEFLDVYKVWYDGGQPITLYINGYDYEDLKCPIGFTFVKFDEIQPVKKITDSLIRETTDCDNKNIFSVDDFLLKVAVGELRNPDKNPGYKGGIDKLKQYFSVNPLTNKRAQSYIFRTSIGFKINCEGETGDFQVVTKGKGDLRELANQVLEIVSNMPSGWVPAESNGLKVDCYQILSFTATYGNLEMVSYR